MRGWKVVLFLPLVPIVVFVGIIVYGISQAISGIEDFIGEELM